MAAKYRKIDPRMWKDEKFRMLTRDQKLLLIYIVTGQSNRIGLFPFSVGMASEELGVDGAGNELAGQRLREELLIAVSAVGWSWDRDTSVIYIPTWWKYNPAGNEKHLKGCLSDIADVPRTTLLTEFAGNRKFIPATLQDRFDETVNRYLYPIETVSKGYGISGAGSGAGSGARKAASPPDSKAAAPPKAPEYDPLLEPLPAPLDTPAFAAAWSEWISYRRDGRMSCRAPTIRKQLELLASLGAATAIECINTAIRSGWKGLFKPNQPAHTTNGRATLSDTARSAAEWAQEENYVDQQD